jgi:hypothetical protein
MCGQPTGLGLSHAGGSGGGGGSGGRPGAGRTHPRNGDGDMTDDEDGIC